MKIDLQLLKKTLLVNCITLCLTTHLFSQAGSYYNSISTSSPTFVTDLETRIRSPYNRVSYDSFDETNIANFASFDNGNGTRSVFCVYTSYEHIYSGVFTWGTMSREHSWAHSWMPTFPSTSNDQYADQYHLFPTHQNNANGRRSNHPYGIVVNVTYQFMDGKVGTNALGHIVYEPRDIHKGDAARSLLYMCVRYDGLGGNTWNFNWLNTTKLPSLSEDPQDLNVLLNWHMQDPPDKWEVDRNNYVQSIQLNRHPFVDHPEYVNYIDFNNLTKLNPVYSPEPANYVTNFSSAANGTSIQTQWNDATGAQLPSGYLMVAYDRNNYFIPIDGSVYTTDTVLTDGFAVVNIPYANPNAITFNNLIGNETYYFSIFSYNGTGSQINYKIDGSFPITNSFIAPSLAAEPQNHVTNFLTGNLTSNSIQLNWNDALPGMQAPTGYLLLANTNNTFVPPSDGTEYLDDVNLSDGNAAVNIGYVSPDNFTFNNLFANTIYYFRIFPYNGILSQRNYKTNGVVPFVTDTTLNSSQSSLTILMDNFNRGNSNILGNTLLPVQLTWAESETVNPGSISLSSNKVKMASTTTGREFAYAEIGSVPGYPSVYSNSGSALTWAINIKQTRIDPSGFDNNNYGVAFVLGKTNSDLITGNGYAVVLGQSGSTDAVRLARFTNGINLNSRFTNIITAGDYSNQYLSIKVIYEPAGNNWSLFVDSSSAGFPQSDPRNTQTQTGFASDNTHTSLQLPFAGVLWNHATGSSDSLMFDDIYTPSSQAAVVNISAIIEGLFETGASNLNLKDTLNIYLRNSTAPYNVVDSVKSVIDSLTYTGTFIFDNVISGNYYIALNHRNSIETWSKNPQPIATGSNTNYDFTTSATKAYGDNMILKNGKYCIYSGDVAGDGTVDISDIIAVHNDAANFVTGYIDTDINGDYFVDISDILICFNNSSNFVSKIVPP